MFRSVYGDDHSELANKYKKVLFMQSLLVMPLCPSCGGTDHTRSSSAKCPNHKKRVREKGLADGQRNEIYNVKRGLASLLCPTLDDEVRRRYLDNIREDVRDLSRMSIEMSYLINFFYKSYFLSESFGRNRFYEAFPKFDALHFAYALKDNARAKPGKIPDPLDKLAEYKRMNDGRVYSGKLRSYSIIWLGKTYETLLKTNMTTHAFRRIKCYMRFLYGKDLTAKDVHQKCSECFYETGIGSEDCAIQKWFRDNDVTCKKIEADYWLYVYLFLTIQRELVENRFGKGFRVFPIYRHGLKYLHYDSNCLYELMRRTEPTDYTTPMSVFMEDRPNAWRRIFELGRYGKNFGCSIMTDGVAVNLSMNRVVTTAKDDGRKRKKTKRLESHTPALSIAEYRRIIAVDPGAKTPVVTCTRIGSESEFSYGALSKGTVSCWNGERHRKRKREAITRTVDEEVRLDMENTERSSNLELSANNPHVTQYTLFQLKWFDRKQAVYERRKRQRLKFDKYMGDQKCLEKIVDRFFGRRGCEKTLVVYGSGVNFMNRSTFRGHRKFRHDALKKAIARRTDMDLTEQDESYTTKTCSHCFCTTGVRTVLSVSKSPHRYVYCSICRKGTHRDRNAAKNILLRFEKAQTPPCSTSIVVEYLTVDHKVESRNSSLSSRH